jgi:hypothetical protein
VAGYGEACLTFDLGDRLIDKTARHLGHCSACRADDVLMMAAAGLEPGSTVSKIETFQLAGLTEAHQRAEDRRGICGYMARAQGGMGLIEGPRVLPRAPEEICDSTADVAWPCHVGKGSDYASRLQYARDASLDDASVIGTGWVGN